MTDGFLTIQNLLKSFKLPTLPVLLQIVEFTFRSLASVFYTSFFHRFIRYHQQCTRRYLVSETGSKQGLRFHIDTSGMRTTKIFLENHYRIPKPCDLSCKSYLSNNLSMITYGGRKWHEALEKAGNEGTSGGKYSFDVPSPRIAAIGNT